MAEQCHCNTAVQVLKVLHHLCPGCLTNWFLYAEAYTGHSGWNNHCLLIPLISNSIGKNGFFYCKAVIWNSLPPVLFTFNILNLYIKGCMLVNLIVVPQSGKFLSGIISLLEIFKKIFLWFPSTHENILITNWNSQLFNCYCICLL